MKMKWNRTACALLIMILLCCVALPAAAETDITLSTFAKYAKVLQGKGASFKDGLPEVLEGKSVSGEIDIEEGAAGIGAADIGSQIDAGDWIVTSYVYDINQEYEQVLSETTQGQTTCYEYGLERISAYGPDGKTDYLYDGRGSVAEQLTTGTDLAENVKRKT